MNVDVTSGAQSREKGKLESGIIFFSPIIKLTFCDFSCSLGSSWCVGESKCAKRVGAMEVGLDVKHQFERCAASSIIAHSVPDVHCVYERGLQQKKNPAYSSSMTVVLS